jgi:hypothetical protein
MAGFEEIPRAMNDQADQVLGADAELLDQAARALRQPASRGRLWQRLPGLAGASLAGGMASWLRQVQQAGHEDTRDELPDLLD